MISCQEYTNKLRLAGPERSVSCTRIKSSHDLLLSTQPSMCVQCEREWVENLFSHGNHQTQTSTSYRKIEGLDANQIIEVKARMVSDSTHNDRDTGSTDHSDNGQVFLGAAVGDSSNGDAGDAGHSDNGQNCLRAVADESESDCRNLACPKMSCATALKVARTSLGLQETAGDRDSFVPTIDRTSPDHFVNSGSEKDSVEIESLDAEGAVCTSPSEASSCDTESSGSSLCGSSLIRYNAIKLRIEEYLEKRQQQREMNTDHKQPDAGASTMEENFDHADVDDPHVALEDKPPTDPVDNPEVDHHSCAEPALDIDLVQQRIEATILKRIEENNEKEAQQVTISKLLDIALLKKDQDDRRERDHELGIEEETHLWDTETLERMWQAKDSTAEATANASIPVSPHTCTSPKSQQAPPTLDLQPQPRPQPQKHIYMGSMFADQKSAYQRGLREIRPYGSYSGEWEGFMLAHSEDDANRQGLLDPIHVRGCCAERRADFHLYYGVMHAPSEVHAENRWLEDIRRIPGEDGKFYGLLRADNLQHARAMGLTDIMHPWGCCKDGLFTMPERMLHRYTGFMCAVSLEAVGRMGLCDAEPVPGECGDYYGGTYNGYVEAYCELEAFQMGLKEPEHDKDCCPKAIPEAGQYTYYGYMYAGSEEEVVKKGLKDVLLVPGFDIKYSGYLLANSEEEAKALGLFEPSHIE
ncbi:hypothetical protein PDIG_48320 [Penicillium digitatum PHI26]|uniref:Uncharacterized protein n=3 Tax=Penicillium digitatum TaxID=36651 RepID=K9GAB1_PEND2|nr:hypothetical protein PDIP_57700 [Penicillium digitatum Pd1]EKV11095.1 hypothetical protein PDIP_57700 [Penicillium digitatum Pd1]EKV11818.1 hypothetical protein PDIG_48320 [Penicillium digitatum PHI26]